MTSKLYYKLQKTVDRLPPSVIYYSEFQAAFDFYRDQLFDGDLKTA